MSLSSFPHEILIQIISHLEPKPKRRHRPAPALFNFSLASKTMERLTVPTLYRRIVVGASRVALLPLADRILRDPLAADSVLSFDGSFMPEDKAEVLQDQTAEQWRTVKALERAAEKPDLMATYGNTRGWPASDDLEARLFAAIAEIAPDGVREACLANVRHGHYLRDVIHLMASRMRNLTELILPGQDHRPPGIAKDLIKNKLMSFHALSSVAVFDNIGEDNLDIFRLPSLRRFEAHGFQRVDFPERFHPDEQVPVQPLTRQLLEVPGKCSNIEHLKFDSSMVTLVLYPQLQHVLSICRHLKSFEYKSEYFMCTMRELRKALRPHNDTLEELSLSISLYRHEDDIYPAFQAVRADWKAFDFQDMAALKTLVLPGSIWWYGSDLSEDIPHRKDLLLRAAPKQLEVLEIMDLDDEDGNTYLDEGRPLRDDLIALIQQRAPPYHSLHTVRLRGIEHHTVEYFEDVWREARKLGVLCQFISAGNQERQDLIENEMQELGWYEEPRSVDSDETSD